MWFEGQDPLVDPPKEIAGVMQNTLEETIEFATGCIETHWNGECECQQEGGKSIFKEAMRAVENEQFTDAWLAEQLDNPPNNNEQLYGLLVIIHKMRQKDKNRWVFVGTCLVAIGTWIIVVSLVAGVLMGR
jgi:hypothetical protein